jgi:hypothetical protein
MPGVSRYREQDIENFLRIWKRCFRVGNSKPERNKGGTADQPPSFTGTEVFYINNKVIKHIVFYRGDAYGQHGLVASDENCLYL